MLVGSHTACTRQAAAGGEGPWDNWEAGLELPNEGSVGCRIKGVNRGLMLRLQEWERGAHTELPSERQETVLHRWHRNGGF